MKQGGLAISNANSNVNVLKMKLFLLSNIIYRVNILFKIYLKVGLKNQKCIMVD